MAEQEEQNKIVIQRAQREDVATIVRLLADDVLGQHREHYAATLPATYYAALRKLTRIKITSGVQ